jgi:hypothetical protein
MQLSSAKELMQSSLLRFYYLIVPWDSGRRQSALGLACLLEIGNGILASAGNP